MSIEQGIKALGKDCFLGIRYSAELNSDGPSKWKWSVEFMLDGLPIWTEPCVTVTEALAVAYKAKTEAETRKTNNGN